MVIGEVVVVAREVIAVRVLVRLVGEFVVVVEADIVVVDFWLLL